jgi:hypothetical protein
MSNIIKNLAAVADAPLSTHSLAYISRMLCSAENRDRLFIVAHGHSGEKYSTTVYDVLAHHLYRAVHPTSIGSWIKAVSQENKSIQFLKKNEILRLQIVEDKRVERQQLIRV